MKYEVAFLGAFGLRITGASGALTRFQPRVIYYTFMPRDGYSLAIIAYNRDIYEKGDSRRKLDV